MSGTPLYFKSLRLFSQFLPSSRHQACCNDLMSIYKDTVCVESNQRLVMSYNKSPKYILRPTGQCMGPSKIIDRQNETQVSGIVVQDEHIKQEQLSPFSSFFTLPGIVHDTITPLGKGGFGTAYLCQFLGFNKDNHKPVVMKFPNSLTEHPRWWEALFNFPPTQTTIDEFRQEAQSAQILTEGPCATSVFPPGKNFECVCVFVYVRFVTFWLFLLSRNALRLLD